MGDEDLHGRRRILASAARHDRHGCLLQESAAQGAPDETRDAVDDEAKTMFMSGAGCGVRPAEPRDRLNRQAPEGPRHRRPRDQVLRLAAFFGERRFADAGAQQAAAASAATRLQSSGWPSQQSLTRNAINDRIPSTSER